ncbi:EamA family transporter [Klugiella xanthotipulae]|uniref:Threonine/homoserine efflux transporter RhtA n=1 Tax=Klugiella xanthotipulae TaxID=244735 RepID=A0A543HT58_9MICO|nr:DMT family transporter [Klugiella xanthotipulae]TQM61449.1 threonine/homoserine efflux transporter RhtA [Klugiella xanthotipulae]
MNRGYAYALLSAFLFGLNGSVAKVVLAAGITAAQLTFLRVLTTCVIAGLALLFTHRSGFRLTPRHAVGMLALGLLGVSGLQFFYATAITMLPVGITLLIEYTSVLMVALIAFFAFREAVRPRLWLALGLVLAGLAVVSHIWASQLSSSGVAFAFGAALCYTAYFLVGERAVGATSPLVVSFWSMLAATIFWAFFSGWWQLDLTALGAPVSLSDNLAQLNPPLWLPLLWTLTMGSFAPFYLSFLALKHLPATAAGIVGTSEVIFAFIVAWLWLNETLDVVQILGVIVVMLGIGVAQTARQDHALDLSLATQELSLGALRDPELPPQVSRR